jgi:RNA polymerase sigma factor (sigma-70 family)
MDKALNLLPEDQKTVIILRDYAGYTYEEIGEIEGLSESQVCVYIFRARNFLRQHLGKIEEII